MGSSKFEGVSQGLSFLKNYSSLLWPIIIGLVAVLFLVLTPLMGSKLEEKIASESKSKGGSVVSLSRDAISSKQNQEERKYQDAYENDANQIAVLIKQSGRRQLLSYKIFPEPKDASAMNFEEFSRQFRTGLDELLVKIKAGDCPTDTELERAMNSSSSRSRGRRRDRNPVRSMRDPYSKLNEVDDMIVSELCRAKAKSACVYADPVDLGGYEFWDEYEYAGMDKAVEDCWYWQLGYWVIEDIIDTICTINSGSDSVFTSSVKRLMTVNFAKQGGRRSRLRYAPRGRSRSGRNVASEMPSYVLSIVDGFTEPYTGRLSNDDIDIVHFNVSVLVRTKAIPLFMQQLCSSKEYKFRGFFGKEPEQTSIHNQITILEYDIKPIDRESGEHKLYQYGEDAVVKLDLICEYIFEKSGYDEVKPESIKESLKPPA